MPKNSPELSFGFLPRRCYHFGAVKTEGPEVGVLFYHGFYRIAGVAERYAGNAWGSAGRVVKIRKQADMESSWSRGKYR